MKLVRRRRVRWGVLGGLVLVSVAAAVAFMWLRSLHSETVQTPAIVRVQPPSIEAVESNIMVVGDVFWGRYVNDWAQASELKYAYPFQRLSEFGRSDYDAWINDMECPITNNPKVSSAVEDSTLAFDCDPAYLPEAKKWFSAMTLANNHTDNQNGQTGLAETRKHLDENGIQYFGSFDPSDHDNLCDVLSLPARATMSDGSKKQVSLPMAWCGYHGVFKTPDADSLAVMKRYADYMPVIAMPHSGAEYKAEPDEIKTSWYRGLIDNGASVVIGDHPHWVQTSEAYKGKLVLYSLGNFIFDQQFNSEVTRGVALGMRVSVKTAENQRLTEWVELAKTCARYQDSCLADAKTRQLPKLDPSYHFSIQASDNSGKVTKKASENQLASIKQRLQWDASVRALQGKQTGQ